ncbi:MULTISPECIES: hypothetical protein [Deinococcus]|uniref:Uncharacterized protein n=1 Tax=Deinococcus phoenicis TaxID=1476583 RepID=A0A016QJH4_9DEIO|nr:MULTISPECIES: hypothetical protein [Deinococcus]EYB66325.1 hypothetical protein DEIPH_ctg139orf0042 [Deinococcus phoenicis]MBI0445522.1 hypothetical protein [Deinococcus sp. DB0503]
MTEQKLPFTDSRIPYAAALSMLAAVLHGGVTGAHFTEGFGYGQFFLVATAAQFVWGGFLLLRSLEARAAQSDPHPRVGSSRLEVPYSWGGVLGNSAMYFVTRTVGIPWFGPEAGEVEAWDAFGLITTALELLLVALLLVMLFKPAVPRPGRRRGAR